MRTTIAVLTMLTGLVLAAVLCGCPSETSHRMGLEAPNDVQQSFVLTVTGGTAGLSALVPPAVAMPSGTLANVQSDAGAPTYYYYAPYANDASAGGAIGAAPGGYWIPFFVDGGLGGH
jgi:hypothetical protein